MSTTYWIAKAADSSYFAGETPDGYQTLLGNGVTGSWNSDNHEQWLVACREYKIEVSDASQDQEPGAAAQA